MATSSSDDPTVLEAFESYLIRQYNVTEEQLRGVKSGSDLLKLLVSPLVSVKQVDSPRRVRRLKQQSISGNNVGNESLFMDTRDRRQVAATIWLAVLTRSNGTTTTYKSTIEELAAVQPLHSSMQLYEIYRFIMIRINQAVKYLPTITKSSSSSSSPTLLHIYDQCYEYEFVRTTLVGAVLHRAQLLRKQLKDIQYKANTQQQPSDRSVVVWPDPPDPNELFRYTATSASTALGAENGVDDDDESDLVVIDSFLLNSDEDSD